MAAPEAAVLASPKREERPRSARVMGEATASVQGAAPQPPSSRRPSARRPKSARLPASARSMGSAFAPPMAPPPRSARRGSSPKSARSARSSNGGNPFAVVPFSERPAWDDTPLRQRPPALRGIYDNTGREPWARDEFEYNRRFDSSSDFTGNFDIASRNPFDAGRMMHLEFRRTHYLSRWNQKFEAGYLYH